MDEEPEYYLDRIRKEEKERLKKQTTKICSHSIPTEKCAECNDYTIVDFAKDALNFLKNSH